MVAALVLLGLSVVFALVRLFRGPTAADRIVAMDVVANASMAIAIFAAIWADDTVYLDLVVVMAVLVFLGSVALARYLESEHHR